MHERDSKPSKHTSTQHKHIHSFTPTFHAPFNVCAAHTILQHYQNKTKRVSMKSALIKSNKEDMLTSMVPSTEPYDIHTDELTRTSTFNRAKLGTLVVQTVILYV